MTEHHYRDKHLFYLSTHRLEAPHARMNVGALKQFIAQHVPEFNPGYTLVLEERGDRPDKPLSDGDEVHIHEIPHFYDQPPAVFG
jgi:hypothetical protein